MGKQIMKLIKKSVLTSFSPGSRFLSTKLPVESTTSSMYFSN